MDLKQLLSAYKNGDVGLDDVLRYLQKLPFENLEFAHIDHHRQVRQGYPEVILCEGKTDEHIEKIVGALLERNARVLASRATQTTYDRLQKLYPQLHYNAAGRMIYMEPETRFDKFDGRLLILCAGTSDIPVAEEAFQTAYALGFTAKKIYDVGVAGIHRLFHYKDDIDHAAMIIVIAGMEGALASVVGGLARAPVIAVPTSVGYGTSFGGVTALLAMLNSCASGITVVNIDNGFGAAFAAARYLRQLAEVPTENKKTSV